MNRRDSVLAFLAMVATAGPLPLRAQQQQAGRMYRVAIVLTTSPIAELAGPDPIHPLTRQILHRLRDLGYVEGRNLIFDRRSAEGDPTRYSQIVGDLVRLNTDAIILSTDPRLIRTAHEATRTIPLLMMGYYRVVEDGFAASLARPGGNITGLAAFSPQEMRELTAKRLQLFKQAVPRLRRVAYLGPPVKFEIRGSLAEVAAALGITLLPVVAHATDPQDSFARIAQLQVDGLFVEANSTTFANREQLGRLAYLARLPSMFWDGDAVVSGGLMSYEALPSIANLANYADRIFKGAYPGDLPMELPSKFRMWINLQAAKALGLTIPQSLLLQADRLIE